MAIHVTCSCGKSMRAPIEWAGHNAKCPGCGQTIHIPGHGSAPSTPPPTDKLPVAPCPACGKPLMVPPGMAGKLVACPACGGHVTLPGPGKPAAAVTARAPAVTVPPSPPRSKSVPSKPKREAVEFQMDGGDDDEDDRDEDRRPSRRNKKLKSGKKAKSSGFPVVLIAGLAGGGFVALLVIVGLVLFLLRSGGGGPVLAMVPADVDWFARVRVGDFLKTPSGQKLRKMALDNMKDASIAAEIDNWRDVVVFGNVPNEPLAAVSTFLPIDPSLSEKNLANTHTKKSLEGKTFFAPKQGENEGIFLYAPQMLLMGSEANIVNYLKKPPVTEGPMAPSIRAAGADSNMFFVAFHGGALKKAGGGPMGPMAMMGVFPEIKSGRVMLSDGSRITGNVALDFADDASAKTAKDHLDTMLGALRLTAPQQVKMMPAGMGDMAIKALDKARPTQSGATINVPIEVDSTIGELAEKLQPLMAMMAFGGGPGPGFGPGPGIGGPGPGIGGPGPIPQPKMPTKKKKF